jgi:glutathione S-transferase
MARLVRAGPDALNRRPTGRLSKRAMSCEFEGLDATEKAGIEAALNRCRALADQLESELSHKKPEHFVDKLSVADLCASLEQAADVLGQKGRKSVETTPTHASGARGRQWHR